MIVYGVVVYRHNIYHINFLSDIYDLKIFAVISDANIINQKR